HTIFSRDWSSDVCSSDLGLALKLIDSLTRTNSNAPVLISSSIQEETDTPYGKSKKEGREALVKWANENGGKVSGLIIPNVFGAKIGRASCRERVWTSGGP